MLAFTDQYNNVEVKREPGALPAPTTPSPAFLPERLPTPSPAHSDRVDMEPLLAVQFKAINPCHEHAHYINSIWCAGPKATQLKMSEMEALIQQQARLLKELSKRQDVDADAKDTVALTTAEIVH